MGFRVNVQPLSNQFQSQRNQRTIAITCKPTWVLSFRLGQSICIRGKTNAKNNYPQNHIVIANLHLQSVKQYLVSLVHLYIQNVNRHLNWRMLQKPCKLYKPAYAWHGTQKRFVVKWIEHTSFFNRVRTNELNMTSDGCQRKCKHCKAQWNTTRIHFHRKLKRVYHKYMTM